MIETRPLAAAAAMLAAMLIIGFIDNFVVVIAENHGLWQFQFLRTLMALPMVAAMTLLGMGGMRPLRWRAVAARSLFLSAAMMLYFGALAFLPIAEAVAGLFTSPVWVMIISVLFLGERVGPIRIGAAVAGFVGVILVLRPDAEALSPMVLVPVLAGFLYAIGAIATRRWCSGESALSLLAGNFLAMGAWSALGLLVLTLFPQIAAPGPEGFLARGWVAPDGPFWFWTFVQALGSVVGVWLIVRAYQLGEASFSASFEYSLLVFVAAWAWILRGETLDPFALVGIGVIVASGAVIALRGR
jgi:drug/metabolite transporter (DMT)-like permease